VSAEAPRFPVSVKGVVLRAGRVILLKNERDEWELPGGRLEIDETPEGCVVREITEELGLAVAVGPLLDCWIYEPLATRRVLIVAYGCTLVGDATARLSREHAALAWFDAGALDGIALPAGYRRAIARWHAAGAP
jgi:8-oxo-dGTP pyrophosphatase MutT (NUDIX family)